MVDEILVRNALREIDDPEMPISIVDLGLIGGIRVIPSHEDATKSDVAIDLLPTFVGCFALPFIEAAIAKRIRQFSDVAQVTIQAMFDPPWTIDRISPEGRERLRQHGVTVPTEHPSCPFCGSPNVRLDSPFGPTRCRTIFYCDHCRHTFEQLKRIEKVAPLVQLGNALERGK